MCIQRSVCHLRNAYEKDKDINEKSMYTMAAGNSKALQWVHFLGDDNNDPKSLQSM